MIPKVAGNMDMAETISWVALNYYGDRDVPRCCRTLRGKMQPNRMTDALFQEVPRPKPE